MQWKEPTWTPLNAVSFLEAVYLVDRQLPETHRGLRKYQVLHWGEKEEDGTFSLRLQFMVGRDTGIKSHQSPVFFTLEGASKDEVYKDCKGGLKYLGGQGYEIATTNFSLPADE